MQANSEGFSAFFSKNLEYGRKSLTIHNPNMILKKSLNFAIFLPDEIMILGLLTFF